MLIGGLEKLSLIDFPGEIAAVIFTRSCNFRCHFCYNPMLVLAPGEGEIKYKEEDLFSITEEDLFLFLKERQGKLSGVVISGGEPTLQTDLKEFIKKIKAMGFKVKLDSNGTNPEILEDLIRENLLDYIAMDFKAPLNKYEKVVGVKVDIDKIKKSLDLLRKDLVPHEFRSTLVPGLHDLNDLIIMSEEIAGSSAWFLQRFISNTNLVNPGFQGLEAFKIKDIEEILKKVHKNTPNCQIRE